MSQIKISNDSEGHLQKAAMKQGSFAKDRKEVRDLQARAAKEQAKDERGPITGAQLLHSSASHTQTMFRNFKGRKSSLDTSNRPRDAIQFSRKQHMSMSICKQKE